MRKSWLVLMVPGGLAVLVVVFVVALGGMMVLVTVLKHGVGTLRRRKVTVREVGAG